MEGLTKQLMLRFKEFVPPQLRFADLTHGQGQSTLNTWFWKTHQILEFCYGQPMTVGVGLFSLPLLLEVIRTQQEHVLTPPSCHGMFWRRMGVAILEREFGLSMKKSFRVCLEIAECSEKGQGFDFFVVLMKPNPVRKQKVQASAYLMFLISESLKITSSL